MKIKHELNYNPFSKEYKWKLSEVTEDRKENLKLLDSIDSKKLQLEVIKKTNEKPKKGDVFVIEPIKGDYYYGLVLENNINSDLIWINGTNIIVIFNSKTNELDTKNYTPNFNDLIVRVSCVDNFYWEKGYFYKVGEDHISNVSYGFFELYNDRSSGYFIDYKGKELPYIPKIYNMLAITTGIGIAIESIWELYFKGENEKINKFVEEEVKLVEKNKNYIQHFLEEDYCGISIYADAEQLIKLSKYISKKTNTEILLNGSDLEALIEKILKKENPELLVGLDADPEAGFYIAYYELDDGGEEKSKKLYKIIKSYLDKRTKLTAFIQEHINDIEWS